MNRWKRHLDVYEHIKQGLSTTDIIWHCRMMTATTTARREFEEHIDETDDAIWSALNSTTKWDVSSSRSINIKKEYESRLLSFRASTYYAKPACLSPLICARFGYVPVILPYPTLFMDSMERQRKEFRLVVFLRVQSFCHGKFHSIDSIDDT